MTADVPEPQAPERPRGLAGIGAAALAIEALVVLLATPMVISLKRGVPAAGVGYLLAVVVVLVLAAAVQRRPYGRAVGSIAQVLVIAAGWVTWAMYVLGVVFAALWLGYLRLGRPGPAR